jgi:hypothetical protein
MQAAGVGVGLGMAEIAPEMLCSARGCTDAWGRTLTGATYAADKNDL